MLLFGGEEGFEVFWFFVVNFSCVLVEEKEVVGVWGWWV